MTALNAKYFKDQQDAIKKQQDVVNQLESQQLAKKQKVVSAKSMITERGASVAQMSDLLAIGVHVVPRLNMDYLIKSFLHSDSNYSSRMSAVQGY